jgi:hypothetical protein
VCIGRKREELSRLKVWGGDSSEEARIILAESVGANRQTPMKFTGC